MQQSVWGSEKTQYFYELSPDKILESAEKIGLKATGRILQLNSMENRVYEIELDAEVKSSKYDSFRVIKFYRPGRWNVYQIREEHQFLLDLVADEVPVCAPEKLENGETVGECDGLFYAIFPKIGGRTPDELSAEQYQQIGRLMARMHLVGAAKKSEHRFILNVENFGKNSTEYIKAKKLIPIDLESRYMNTADSIIQLLDIHLSNVDRQRIHGDCHLGNLLWGTDGPFWVDFDDMLRGPKVQDLWLMLPGRDEYGMQMRQNLLMGYQSMADFNLEELKLIEGLRALRFMHFSSWIARRWEDPAFKRAFTWFNTWEYWNEQTSDLEMQLRLLQDEYR